MLGQPMSFNKKLRPYPLYFHCSIILPDMYVCMYVYIFILFPSPSYLSEISTGGKNVVYCIYCFIFTTLFMSRTVFDMYWVLNNFWWNDFVNCTNGGNKAHGEHLISLLSHGQYVMEWRFEAKSPASESAR